MRLQKSCLLQRVCSINQIKITLIDLNFSCFQRWRIQIWWLFMRICVFSQDLPFWIVNKSSEFLLQCRVHQTVFGKLYDERVEWFQSDCLFAGLVRAISNEISLFLSSVSSVSLELHGSLFLFLSFLSSIFIHINTSDSPMSHHEDDAVRSHLHEWFLQHFFIPSIVNIFLSSLLFPLVVVWTTENWDFCLIRFSDFISFYLIDTCSLALLLDISIRISEKMIKSLTRPVHIAVILVGLLLILQTQCAQAESDENLSMNEMTNNDDQDEIDEPIQRFDLKKLRHFLLTSNAAQLAERRKQQELIKRELVSRCHRNLLQKDFKTFFSCSDSWIFKITEWSRFRTIRRNEK